MVTKKKKIIATKPNSPAQQRLWLMYPPKLIKKPLIWEVAKRFKVSAGRISQMRREFAESWRRFQGVAA